MRIIIGAGQVGYRIPRRLISEDKDVVIVDTNRQVLETVAESLDLETVHGSGSSPRILEQVDIDFVTSFAAAIACIGNIRPGLGDVGPADNYAGPSPPSGCSPSACSLAVWRSIP